MVHSLKQPKEVCLHMSFVYLICFHLMVQLQCGGPSNVGDLEKQSFYRFLRSTYVFHPIVLGGLLYALGGFPFLVWGMVREHF